MKRSSKSKMSLPKKIFLWVFGILVILAIVAVVYVAAKIFITGNKIHNPLDRNHSELRDKKVSLNDGDPFTIALFGVDSDADRKKKGGGERSDSIMILSINPKTKKTEIVSIPRVIQERKLLAVVLLKKLHMPMHMVDQIWLLNHLKN